MGHVVLMGDSIFDNGAYVRGGPDVVEQLRNHIPGDWQASLVAVDGATTGGVDSQLARLPKDATHLVVSAGGNDALGQSHLLAAPSGSVSEALIVLAAVQERFAILYEDMVERLLAPGLPVALCTIYDTPPSRPEQPVIRTALTLFNDVISRTAFARSLPLLDLRLVCNHDEDYANPIEPSVTGGEKIAGAIARLLRGWNQFAFSIVVV